MRASLTAVLPLILLTACSQAPVQPAQAVAACPPPAAAPATPPPLPAYPMAPVPVHEVPVDDAHREVKIETNMGDITVQLDAKRAPDSVNAFLRRANSHKY